MQDWEAIETFVSPANLEELNNYRNGLLHKKGLGLLQPHSYVGKGIEEVQFRELFLDLHAQHTRNSIVIICALAILTDKLVELDPPTSKEMVDFQNLSTQMLPAIAEAIKKMYESSETESSD